MKSFGEHVGEAASQIETELGRIYDETMSAGPASEEIINATNTAHAEALRAISQAKRLKNRLKELSDAGKKYYKKSLEATYNADKETLNKVSGEIKRIQSNESRVASDRKKIAYLKKGAVPAAPGAGWTQAEIDEYNSYRRKKSLYDLQSSLQRLADTVRDTVQ